MTPEREAEIRQHMNADYEYGDAEMLSGEGQELLKELDRLRASEAAVGPLVHDLLLAVGEKEKLLNEEKLQVAALTKERDAIFEATGIDAHDDLPEKIRSMVRSFGECITECGELRVELERLRAEQRITAADELERLGRWVREAREYDRDDAIDEIARAIENRVRQLREQPKQEQPIPGLPEGFRIKRIYAGRGPGAMCELERIAPQDK